MYTLKRNKKRAVVIVGLDAHRRIDWQLEENQRFEHYAKHGLSVNFICEDTGLTQGQVHNRLAKKGLQLWDVRNGNTEFAKVVKADFKVTKA